MTYVEKLKALMKSEKFTIPGKDLENEEVARAIYQSHMWLKDPVNNLCSRIGGTIFIKEDYVRCTENRHNVATGCAILPTQEEKYKIMRYKEDIRLLKECEQMIKYLSDELK